MWSPPTWRPWCRPPPPRGNRRARRTALAFDPLPLTTSPLTPPQYSGGMPDNDRFRRYLEAGAAFTELTRRRAEGIVRDLVHSGEVSREQATARVEELLEHSR